MNCAHIDDCDEYTICPMCGGAEAVHLGDLGDNVIWRCRQCGTDYTEEA